MMDDYYLKKLVENQYRKIYDELLSNVNLSLGASTSTHSREPSSLSYETLMEAYKKIEETTMPQLKCIVVTHLITNNSFNKYDIGNNQFAVLVHHATWIDALDFLRKQGQYKVNEPYGIVALSGIPVYENDAMAYNIMTKGVLEYMPLPKPNKEEKKEDFISRAMSNPVMKKEYPDTDQRLAVANSLWDKRDYSWNTDNVPDTEE